MTVYLPRIRSVVLTVLTVLVLLPSTGIAEPTSIADTSNVFSSLRAAYTRVQSVHLLARAEIWVAAREGNPAATGTGEFEYWANTDHFRVRSVAASQLSLADDAEIAFDGDRWQLYDLAGSLLAFKRGDERYSPAALPNPFFLPLYFLNPEGEHCKGCAVRFTDLQDPLFWSRTRRARPIGELPSGNNSGKANVYAVDSDSKSHRSYRVELSPVEKTNFSVAVTQLDNDGSRVEVKASQFAPSPNNQLSFPREITIWAYGPAGENTQRIVFRVSILELNRKIDPSLYTLDEGEAKFVFDSDARVYTKHPNPAMVNKVIVMPR